MAALQGLNKAETARRLGADRVIAWRRSYSARPPALEMDDSATHASIHSTPICPRTSASDESYADAVSRLLPSGGPQIAPAVRSGERLLLVAHGNSLRALVQYLEAVPEPDVPAIHVPTGIPIVYTLGPELKPISSRRVLS